MLQLASKQIVGVEMEGLRVYILTFRPVSGKLGGLYIYESGGESQRGTAGWEVRL